MLILQIFLFVLIYSNHYFQPNLFFRPRTSRLSLSLFPFQVFFLFLFTRRCGAREENVQFTRRKMCAHLRKQAKEQCGVGKSVKEQKKRLKKINFYVGTQIKLQHFCNKKCEKYQGNAEQNLIKTVFL